MKTIALLSGKGGSGKTTLGLTMSQILSKAGINVLLVDCDFSTHGATYFFEEQLPWNPSALAFMDIILQKEFKKNFIVVDKHFCFIPSVKHISEKIENLDFLNSEGTMMQISKFIHSVSFKYIQEEMEKGFFTRPDRTRNVSDDMLNGNICFDVIIFDCQAGSSSILPSLLPLVDSALMVLEADKVSSSALRSIYTHTSVWLAGKKTFQVFHKVDKEEKEFYETVTFGTFFINVGALLYDQSIRKAFALSIIPDVEDEGVEYGLQICDLCINTIIDRSVRDKVNVLKKQLVVKKKKDEYLEVEEKLKKDNKQCRKVNLITSFLLFDFILLGVLVCLYYFGSLKGYYKSHFETLTTVLLSIGLALALLILIISVDTNPYNNRKKSKAALKRLSDEINEILSSLEEDRKDVG